MDFFINTFLCTNKLGQEAKEEGEDEEFGSGKGEAAAGQKDEQVALKKKKEEQQVVGQIEKKSPKRHQESKVDGKGVKDGTKAIQSAEKYLFDLPSTIYWSISDNYDAHPNIELHIHRQLRHKCSIKSQ
ncbi:MAG: hypothetical protein MHMPM18_005122 [Marteilia pararefringens]